MIILDATTKSLQFKLAGAVTTNQLPFSASYIDTTSTATTPVEQDGASNNTTAVNVVSAPAASTQRLVKSIVIQNADTVAAKVTIIYNNNSTLRNIFVATLAVGDQLIYEDGQGWSCVDANGNIKTSGSGGSGNFVQRVSTIVTGVATGTTIIPYDDTIPQNTEGDQYMSLSITPQSASNILVIDVILNITNSNTVNITAALFQDSTANALAAVPFSLLSGSFVVQLVMSYVMTAGTTSATTFKVRAGGNTTGTTTFNGVGGSRLYGGVMASSIIINEYKP